MADLKTPLFLALDVDSAEKALELAQELSPFVGGFKVGPRLSAKFGGSLIEKLSGLGPVFLDNKYYDIPSTMTSAVQCAFDCGASYVTIHAQAGSEALASLFELEKKLNNERPFRILSVTVLTSYSEKTAPPNWKKLPFVDQVESLSDLTLRSGLKGLVCSPQEVKGLRRRHPESFIVTPGIRLSDGAQSKDQVRVGTPEQALSDGASALVVGRPIIEAQDPKAQAQKFYELIEKAQRLSREQNTK